MSGSVLVVFVFLEFSLGDLFPTLGFLWLGLWLVHDLSSRKLFILTEGMVTSRNCFEHIEKSGDRGSSGGEPILLTLHGVSGETWGE